MTIIKNKIREKCFNAIKTKTKLMESAEVYSPKKLNFIGNYKCHLNCLSYALKHSKKVKNIVSGIQMFDDDAVAHFIIELKNGKYIDITYGNVAYALYSDFIIVKKYNDFSNFNAGRELDNMKEYIYNMLPFYLKLLTNKKEF